MEIRRCVLYDLRQFVPENYCEGIPSYDPRIWIHDYQLGKKLAFSSNPNMNRRQHAASELLMRLGMVAAGEHIPDQEKIILGNQTGKQFHEENKRLLPDWVRYYAGHLSPRAKEYLLRLIATESSNVIPIDRGWKDKAKAIAQEVGLEKYRRDGVRNISARSVCDEVAVRLAKDPSTHGLQGQRSADNVRVDGLKNWKFIPPEEEESVD